MTKPTHIDGLPEELLMQLTKACLVHEILRLRNMLKDSQRANQSKRKKCTHFRRALRTKHENFKALLARSTCPRSSTGESK